MDTASLTRRAQGIALGLSIMIATGYSTAGQSAAGGVQVKVPVESFREREFSRIYKQRFDYSCGSAAIASVSQALTRGELAATRGGFSSVDGFDFSFGLTQIQRVNGEPAIRQQLIRADGLISRLCDGRASAGESNASPRPVVLQRGAGNRIAPAVLAGRAGIPDTIIQNSLDDQIIRNTRIYDFRLDHVRALTRRLDRSLGRAALSQRLVDSIH